MENAFPFGVEEKPERAPRKAAAFPAPAHDAFKAKAEQQALRQAEKNAKRGKPAAIAGAGAAATFYNPFSTSPVRASGLKPATAKSRVLSNGAELQLVSSKAEAKPKPKPEPKPKAEARPEPKPVSKPKPKPERIEQQAEPAVAIFTPLPAAAAAATIRASATTASDAPLIPVRKTEPAPAKAPKEPKRKGGGGGSDGGGGSYWGNDGVAAKARLRDRAFDQDDFAGILIALALLLLLGWMWMQGLGKSTGPVLPQLAANEPTPAAKPLADPFGPGPVDLRPTSPIPEPAVETAQLTPEAVPPVAAPQAAPAPPPPVQQAVALPPAPLPGKPLHVYFCTARSTMTETSRAAFIADLASWKTSIRDGEVIVTGYADTRGTTEFNSQLAELRADYLAGLLREQGLKVTEAVGVGEIEGIEDGRNCQNQRRVDIGLKSDASVTPSKACAAPKEIVPLECV